MSNNFKSNLRTYSRMGRALEVACRMAKLVRERGHLCHTAIVEEQKGFSSYFHCARAKETFFQSEQSGKSTTWLAYTIFA